jgi:hypothetical protein
MADDKPSADSKKRLFEELDRRIRGVPESNIVEQMERDQRNASLMNDLIEEFTSKLKQQ